MGIVTESGLLSLFKSQVEWCNIKVKTVFLTRFGKKKFRSEIIKFPRTDKNDDDKIVVTSNSANDYYKIKFTLKYRYE